MSPLTPDQIIADYRRRKQEQYACPHHDKPLVCGECGKPIGIATPHPFRPAHRVDGVLVRCGA